VQYADREGVVEHCLDRKPVDIALDDVCVLESTRVPERHVYGIAEVDRDHIRGAELGSQERVTAFATPAFQNGLPTEELGPNRMDPVQELLAIPVANLRVVRPLVAEGASRPAFGSGQDRGEPWNAAHDLVTRIAREADQPPSHDLGTFTIAGGDIEIPAAVGACEVFEKPFLHTRRSASRMTYVFLSCDS